MSFSESSHTAPAGVINRVYFEEEDSQRHGEEGPGYFDFCYSNRFQEWSLVNWEASFPVSDRHPLVGEALSFLER